MLDASLTFFKQIPKNTKNIGRLCSCIFSSFVERLVFLPAFTHNPCSYSHHILVQTLNNLDVGTCNNFLIGHAVPRLKAPNLSYMQAQNELLYLFSNSKSLSFSNVYQIKSHLRARPS